MLENARRDTQTSGPGGARFGKPAIDGVEIRDIGNILTRSGVMAEIFRNDWPGFAIDVRQVNWVSLNADGITDWHCHMRQTDRLVSVAGNIKLALWDGRETSPTHGKHDVIRFGIARPAVVTVPPGVWHALRNESGGFAGYLNLTNELYVYEDPDAYRIGRDAGVLPDIL
jgi:dTDP-4-dehydrorhamnose 3,5-epimerase